MAALAPAPKFYQTDENGAPLAGGFVYTYVSGTTTPLATYTDAGGGTANTNPVQLDSAGRCNMWLLADYEYKFVVTSATGTPVYTVNNIAASATLPDVEAYIDSVTTRAVNTIAALRLLPFADWQRAFAFGYYAKGDGGGGSYYYDSTDTTSGAYFTGSVSGTTLTVSAVTNGTLAVNQIVARSDTGAAVAWISALGSGSGGTGTYTLNTSASIASMTMMADDGGSIIVAADGGRWVLNTGGRISASQFGTDATGATDSKFAFHNAIKLALPTYIKNGSYIASSAVVITNPVELYGDGTQKTFIDRNYSPSNDYDGIFNIRDGGSGVIMRDMTLRSLTGQTGGCLVSLVNTASGFGLFKFDHVNMTSTGTSTHQYTFYADGTAATSAPIGIRGLDMVACSLFGAGISTLLVKGVLKFSFLGGGCYTAGGAAGSNVRISGSAAVPTSSFTFLPSDCSCNVSFDYTNNGVFGCGTMGSVSNTSNTQNVYGFGYTGSLQQNWLNSTFMDTSAGIFLSASQKISNKGSAPNFPIEMIGKVAAYAKSGAVTSVGQIGVAYTTECANGLTFSFANESAKLFTINTGGGAAALVFADYKQTTITLLSDPSAEFQASSTPGAGYTGIFKSANSHSVSIKNNTGGTVFYQILVLGAVSSTADPA